jgi:hypothetical protein
MVALDIAILDIVVHKREVVAKLYGRRSGQCGFVLSG